MSDDEPSVPVVCEACGTTTQVPLPDVADAVERHNDNLHDGAAEAGIDPDVTDHITDMVADDLGLLDGE